MAENTANAPALSLNRVFFPQGEENLAQLLLQ